MIEEINKILGEWDPIGIGSPLSFDEYRKYAPEIKRLISDEKELRSYIIQILKEVGLDYFPNNELQNRDIDKVVQEILILKNYRS